MPSQCMTLLPPTTTTCPLSHKNRSIPRFKMATSLWNSRSVNQRLAEREQSQQSSSSNALVVRPSGITPWQSSKVGRAATSSESTAAAAAAAAATGSSSRQATIKAPPARWKQPSWKNPSRLLNPQFQQIALRQTDTKTAHDAWKRTVDWNRFALGSVQSQAKHRTALFVKDREPVVSCIQHPTRRFLPLPIIMVDQEKSPTRMMIIMITPPMAKMTII